MRETEPSADFEQRVRSSFAGQGLMATLGATLESVSPANNGLIYTQWHTTAVCSPTRSCFLTGRNHHANGFGSIAESAVGFPGYSGHISLENGTIAQILRDAGWSQSKPRRHQSPHVRFLRFATLAAEVCSRPIPDISCCGGFLMNGSGCEARADQLQLNSSIIDATACLILSNCKAAY